MPHDLLLVDIASLVTRPVPGAAHGAEMSVLRQLEDPAVAVSGGKISWLGPRREWQGQAAREFACGGAALLPALVDPHTHTVWAGDRLADFEARLSGVTYETILARGGGIRSTVRHTAAASVEELVELARPRLAALQRSGAATVEIKSGYGFSVEAELRSLQAIRSLQEESPLSIIPTLLIHIPPQQNGEREDYLAAVTRELIPRVAEQGLATAVDIFIERESFGVEEARQVFAAARSQGLAIKAHADQFHAIGGTELSVSLGALSVDHLEASTAAQVRALADSSTIATILPGVTLHLGLPAAPGRGLIDAGAALAIGTDLNPGSSPLYSTQLALALGVRLCGLTPAEALVAGTVNAAAALGLSDRGAIAVGQRADLILLHSADWLDLVYTLGDSPVARLFLAGEEVP